MVKKDIVVIGASAGGVEALKFLFSQLPADLPAAVFVVQHTGPSSPNVLDRIFSYVGPLPARTARDGEEIRPGQIYIAPVDHHLLLDPSGRVRVTRGPKENRFRPAVDPLFRSAAWAFGPRVVGVILTGWLDDGTAGLWAVRACGGTAVVQNPEEAFASDMPLNALKHVEVNHSVRLADLAPLLVRLTNKPSDEQQEPKPVRKAMELEVSIAGGDNALGKGVLALGQPSIYTCPECHGVLLQIKEGSHVRFRCHTGHAFSVESLLADCTERTEETLWNALRSIEETILLMRRMAAHLEGHQHHESARALQRRVDEAEARAALVRQVIETHQQTNPADQSPSS